MTATSPQTEFAQAVVDRAAPLPNGATSWNAEKPVKRFNVYRGNVAGALVEALAARYPVVQRLVGDAFFRAMAREFALRNLPRSPVLIGYGADFPAFIAGFEPASSVPYLPDVAKFESAHWEAYHAADCPALPPQAFAAIDPLRFANASVEMLPSLWIVSSTFPVASIWRTNTQDAEPEGVDISVAEAALIVRPTLSVDMRIITSAEAMFFNRLSAGCTIGQAAEQAAAQAPQFDLGSAVTLMLLYRMVARIVES